MGKTKFIKVEPEVHQALLKFKADNNFVSQTEAIQYLLSKNEKKHK